MPNAANIVATQQLIREAGPEHFDMGKYFSRGNTSGVDYYEIFERSGKEFAHTCGTAMCIAGFAAVTAQGDEPVCRLDHRASTIGREFFEITHDQASELFVPYTIYVVCGKLSDYHHWQMAHPAKRATIEPLLERNHMIALHVLDILATEGVVNWPAAYARAGDKRFAGVDTTKPIDVVPSADLPD